MTPEVREALSRARIARSEHRPEDVLAALKDAASAATSDAEHQVAGWRLAKGVYDFGDVSALMDALEPVLATEAPFEHHPTAVAAAEPIAQRVWNKLGYGDVRVLRLWEAYSDHHRAIGDPWLAAMGDVQRAWQLACLGQVAQVRGLLDHYANLSPRRFGRGPTKHPDAWDTTLSLFWVQADMARTLLRCATWTHDEPQAVEAREVYKDALAASERHPDRTWWFVDPVCRAADRFGWTVQTWSPWSRGVANLAEQHPVHTGIAQAILHRRAGRTGPALDALDGAATVAIEVEAGWEWVADAWTERLRIEQTSDLRCRLDELISDKHLHAFR